MCTMRIITYQEFLSNKFTTYLLLGRFRRRTQRRWPVKLWRLLTDISRVVEEFVACLALRSRPHCLQQTHTETHTVFFNWPIFQELFHTRFIRDNRPREILSVDGACLSLVISAMPTPVKTIPELFRPAIRVLWKTGGLCVCTHRVAALFCMKWHHGHHLKSVMLHRDEIWLKCSSRKNASIDAAPEDRGKPG